MLTGVMSFLVIDRDGAPWDAFSGGWNLHIETLPADDWILKSVWRFLYNNNNGHGMKHLMAISVIL